MQSIKNKTEQAMIANKEQIQHEIDTYFNGSFYRYFIFLRTYSRFREDLGRRELWTEVIDRFMGFMKESLGDKLSIGDYKEVKQHILEQKVMPSMRLLWASGDAVRKNNAAAYNCLSGDTKIQTRNGLFRLDELVGTYVDVVGHDGQWHNAQINYFGEQKLFDIVINKGKRYKTLRATADHEWVLSDGSRKKTKELTREDSIPISFASRPIIVDKEWYIRGVRHGLIYGDGTTTYRNGKKSGHVIRLCGDSNQFVEYFDNYPKSKPPSYDGDTVVYLYDKWAKENNLKELPDVELVSSEYLLGFIRGWIAADGSTSDAGQTVVYTNEKGVRWLEQNSGIVGMPTNHVNKLPEETNYGRRKESLFRVYLHHMSVTKDDLLKDEHKSKFVEHTKENRYTRWNIKEVAKEGEIEPVYCATVRQAHSFAMEEGIVTGNCTYTVVDNLKRFREILFLLTSGAGVGFSVERQFVDQLPVIEHQTGHKLPTYVILDSREGWADALHEGIKTWYDGRDIDFSYEKIRPIGSRLKTFGGRASGPEPLRQLLIFTRNIILGAQGRKLRPIETHDICTKIAEVVVAGGTRRSSAISLSDLHDSEMRNSKKGNFYIEHGNRVMANNSAVYLAKPTQAEFIKEWLSLMESGTGERGIFNRHGVIQMMTERRREHFDEYDLQAVGVNPCSEIILRSCQMCNLTSIVCRPDDTRTTLLDKMKVAVILGTYQATLTNFSYLTKRWKNNCEEERLLGVSLNGQYDCALVRNPKMLKELRERAIWVNLTYAKKMEINPSTAVTCIKPEGTGSQMLGCSNGAHPRYARYQIRRVRIAATDPLFELLKVQNVPRHPENGQSVEDATTWVLEFPLSAHEDTITRHDITAIDQLEHWKMLKINYVEHTVSMTVYISKEEWIAVANWLWDNWEIVSGLSFLPKEDDDHVYQLAPNEEVDAKTFKKLEKEFPIIDFSQLGSYEKDDKTSGGGNGCESNLCSIEYPKKL